MSAQIRDQKVSRATDLDECSAGVMKHAKAIARRLDANIMMQHAVSIYGYVEQTGASSA